MYHVSTQSIDKHMVNVHYYYATLGGGGGGDLQSPTKWCEKVETEHLNVMAAVLIVNNSVKSPAPWLFAKNLWFISVCQPYMYTRLANPTPVYLVLCVELWHHSSVSSMSCGSMLYLLHVGIWHHFKVGGGGGGGGGLV